ncbi:glycosyltransferase family 39 protein [bacterium]|nr:glycosyltransferase family 39 protein [candidate division CSSED10-310 bacterium]
MISSRSSYRHKDQIRSFNKRHWQRCLVLFILGVQLLLAGTSGWQKSYTFDEQNHLKYGKQIITEFSFKRFDNSKMPISAINYLAVHIYERLMNVQNGSMIRFLSRLPTMIMGVLLALTVYLWVRRMMSFTPAVASLLVVIFDPNILAHMRLATTDVPVTLMIIASLYQMYLFMVTDRKKALIWSGFFTGLSLLSKFSAAVFWGIFCCLIAIFEIIKIFLPDSFKHGELKSHVNRTLIIGCLWGSVAFFTVWAGFGGWLSFGKIKDVTWHTENAKIFSQELGNWPCPLPLAYVEGLDWCLHDDQQPVEVYYFGKIYKDPVISYYPVLLLFKTPAGTLILWLFAFFSLSKYRMTPILLKWIIMPGIVYFVLTSFFLRSQLGIRFLIVLFPLMAILISVFFKRWSNKYLLCLGWICIGWQMMSVISFYPHFIPYSNVFAGHRELFYRYFADSNVDWGQDDQAVYEKIPSFYGSPFSLAPSKPVPGIVCVRVNDLVGILAPAQKYAWLRSEFIPYDSIGYSYLLYDIPLEQWKRLVSRKDVEPLYQDVTKHQTGIQQTLYKGLQHKIPYSIDRIEKVPIISSPNDLSADPPFTIQWDTMFSIDRCGDYLIGTESDDGSAVWLNDQCIIDNTGPHNVRFECGLFRLKAGMYHLRIRYDDRGGGRFFKLYLNTADIHQDKLDRFIFPE